MNSKLISIGNSKGVRIPKQFLEGWGDGQEVTIVKRDNQIIITPKITTKEHWLGQILSTSVQGEKLAYFPNTFDEEEWTWD